MIQPNGSRLWSLGVSDDGAICWCLTFLNHIGFYPDKIITIHAK